MAANKLLVLACAALLAGTGSGCILQKKEKPAVKERARFSAAAPEKYMPESDMVPGIPPPIAPSEMFPAGRTVRPASYERPVDDYGSYQASRGQGRLDGYSRDAGSGVVYQDDRMTHARINMNDPTGGRAGEEVLYAATGQNNLAAAFANGRRLPGPAPEESPEQSQSFDPANPVGKPFAGAPVGRSNARASRGAKDQPEKSEPKPWEQDTHLYAGRGANARSSAYAPRPRNEETLWPAGTAMAPPAGTPEAPRPAVKTEVRLPAAPPAPAPKTPAKAPAPVPKSAPVDTGADDEIFTPALFLGGGR